MHLGDQPAQRRAVAGRATASARATPGKLGAPTLSATIVSSSSGPSPWRRTTAARSSANRGRTCAVGDAVVLEAGEPRRRHDRVEHEAVDATGVRDRVALGDERAVGHPVEHEPRRLERGAQVLEVVDGVRRGEQPAPVAQPSRAVGDGRARGTVRSEVPVSRCRRGQSSAGAPVPRWSRSTRR